MSYKNFPDNVTSLLLNITCAGRGVSDLNDLEDLVSALRIVRPNLIQLDIFDAWFHMRRQQWQEALYILQSLETRKSHFPLRTALQGCCLYAINDSRWMSYATQALEQKDDAEAARIATVLVKTAQQSLGAIPELQLTETNETTSNKDEAWLNPHYLHV